MNSCTNNFGSNFLSSSSRFTLSIISPPNNHKLSICFFIVFLASPLSIINSMNVINTDSTILLPHLISCLTIFQLSGHFSISLQYISIAEYSFFLSKLYSYALDSSKRSFHPLTFFDDHITGKTLKSIARLYPRSTIENQISWESAKSRPNET